MVTQEQKIGAVVAGTLLSLSVVKVEPAQAGYFGLDFVENSPFRGSIGTGIIQFQNTSLRGFGQETTTISQLQQENSEYVSRSLPIDEYFGGINYETESFLIYLNLPDDATLNFNYGRLTGVNFLIEDDIDSSTYSKGGPKIDAKGRVSFIATGDRYEMLFTGTATFTDGFVIDEITTTTKTYNNDPIKSGSIVFDTREPIPLNAAAVPEPLTCMGALTALGFGIALKRKLARKS